MIVAQISNSKVFLEIYRKSFGVLGSLNNLGKNLGCKALAQSDFASNQFLQILSALWGNLYGISKRNIRLFSDSWMIADVQNTFPASSKVITGQIYNDKSSIMLSEIRNDEKQVRVVVIRRHSHREGIAEFHFVSINGCLIIPERGQRCDSTPP